MKTRGITLLETMLVLAIASTMLVMGIKVYSQFQFQANEQKVLANVSRLLLGLEGFYDANCRQALDSDSTPLSEGQLDPIVTDASTVVLDINADLLTPGFVSSTEWRPNNPLVDNTGPSKGYYVQYNRVQSGGQDPVMSVYACTGPKDSSGGSACDTTSGTVLATNFQQSRVVIWVAQVAVKLSSSLTSAQWTQIKNDLSANCISTLSGESVAACIPTPTANGYLVWTKMPSGYHPDITSDNWTAMPYVKQFNMQYTNDGMATLSGVKNETQDSTGIKTWYNPLNYLCGG